MKNPQRGQAPCRQILDDKLERVQNAMEKEMAAITVADVIRDTEKYAGQSG